MKQLAPWALRTQDILDWCRTYKGPKFHAMLCDPPYEIGFMSKGWDNSGVVFKPELWEALMEHLHPGAFCFAFSSTRTVHRMMVAIEDAGFVIHPIMLAWNFSNGFPKASNPTHAMVKHLDVKATLGKVKPGHEGFANRTTQGDTRFEAGTKGFSRPWMQDEEKRKAYHYEKEYDNEDIMAFNEHRYGLQALKPAFEPVVCFQKPYPKKTKPVVSMIETGAGCLNIGAGRVGTESTVTIRNGNSGANDRYGKDTRKFERVNPPGRWPSNLMLCHLPECRCLGTSKINAGKVVNAKRSGEATKESRKRGSEFATKPGARRGGEETVPTWECADGCPVRELGEQSGVKQSWYMSKHHKQNRDSSGVNIIAGHSGDSGLGDSGTVARYYFQASWDLEIEERIANCVPVKYVAKPANKEKNAGLDSRNSHATIKPLRMVEYLAKLLLPPEGYTRRLLVPFAGSGSEMIGARQAGWERVVGIELLPEHVDIAKQRLTYWETRTLADGHPEGVIKQHSDTPLMKPKHNAWSKPRDHHPKELW